MDRPFDLITFDFDGVLLHNNYNDLFLTVCQESGLRWPTGRESALARFVHDYYGGGQAGLDYQAHGREGYWPVATRHFLKALDAEGDLDAAVAALVHRMALDDVTYFHETGLHELLIALREDGYHLAMLTNRDEKIHDLGGEWGLIEPFDFIGTRETVGKAKPEPDLFHHIAEYFDVPASRALHIGDNPYADVRGAHAAGWQCVLLDPDELFPDWDVPRLRSIHELPGWLTSRPVRA